MIGRKIRKIVNIIWTIEITLTVLAVVFFTLAFALGQGKYMYSGSQYIRAVVLFLFIALILAVIFLLICYVKKIFLEGFGELVEKTESIEKMLEEK